MTAPRRHQAQRRALRAAFPAARRCRGVWWWRWHDGCAQPTATRTCAPRACWWWSTCCPAALPTASWRRATCLSRCALSAAAAAAAAAVGLARRSPAQQRQRKRGLRERASSGGRRAAPHSAASPAPRPRATLPMCCTVRACRQVDGQIVTHFLHLEELLDNAMGRKVDVLFERGGEPVSAPRPNGSVWRCSPPTRTETSVVRPRYVSCAGASSQPPSARHAASCRACRCALAPCAGGGVDRGDQHPRRDALGLPRGVGRHGAGAQLPAGAAPLPRSLAPFAAAQRDAQLEKRPSRSGGPAHAWRAEGQWRSWAIVHRGACRRATTAWWRGRCTWQSPATCWCVALPT